MREAVVNPGAVGALRREDLLPERALPDGRALLAEGRALARVHRIGRSAFLEHHGVASEVDYKRRCAAAGAIMLHAQIGYRDPEKTRRAWVEIFERSSRAGHAVDRYGVCLDWSMGYPAAERAGRPRGTGLILERPEDFVRLTAGAPVAPHFGDFVMGTPAAVENTAAALAAGATAVGNLGQYFTFRLPGWDDDVRTTAETVRAIGLAAAQPAEVLIHSNLDDGFAALFCDLACALGAVLIERHLVEDLAGGRVGHCYGHTFSDACTRLAFQRALARVTATPGTMVYGNTTSFGADEGASWASLASYLLVDVLAQRTRPTGHAVNAVPVTEALRIPEVDEIVAAQRFAARLVEHADRLAALLDASAAESLAGEIVAGGEAFRDRVLAGLAGAGIDTGDPLELMLALRRAGPRRLEALYGPGAPDPGRPRGRAPLVQASPVAELEAAAARVLGNVAPAVRASLRARGLRACTAATDVHEYGKLLVESALGALGVVLVDAGVSVDPAHLAQRAHAAGADFVALSTYNGIALDYVERLSGELARLGAELPVYVGGKLNQIPGTSNTSLPVDVSAELRAAGAIACRRVEDMLEHLAESGAPDGRAAGGPPPDPPR